MAMPAAACVSVSRAEGQEKQNEQHPSHDDTTPAGGGLIRRKDNNADKDSDNNPNNGPESGFFLKYVDLYLKYQ